MNYVSTCLLCGTFNVRPPGLAPSGLSEEDQGALANPLTCTPPPCVSSLAACAQVVILGSKGVVLNMTASWLAMEDERKYNRDVVEALVRARLLALTELDAHLAKVCGSLLVVSGDLWCIGEDQRRGAAFLGCKRACRRHLAKVAGALWVARCGAWKGHWLGVVHAKEFGTAVVRP